MAINTAAYPYYDDYDSSKGYHRILFHPAKPVQARELTQMQSILQEQVKRHGDHIFKNGTMVIPGHVFYDNKVKYLKLETTYNQINIEDYLAQLKGKKIAGATNDIEATVIFSAQKTDTDPTTIFIKYTSGSGTIQEFLPGEILSCPEISGCTFKIQTISSYTGLSSLCSISEGIYYINGYFVGVSAQTVIMSKYSSDISAIVGLNYIEDTITENEDESLYDNAFGFTNYGAPGAHRLKISLVLVSKDYDDISLTTSSDVDFIELLHVKNGNIEFLQNSTKYAEIEKWLAKRTFEESGNYVTRPFSFLAADYRNNDIGLWTQNMPVLIGDVVTNSQGKYYISLGTGYTGTTEPSQTYGIASDGAILWNEIKDKYNFINKGHNRITSTALTDHKTANEKMVVTTSAGKAYIEGFAVELYNPSYSVLNKARTILPVENTNIYKPIGSYILVNSVRGLPDVSSNLLKIDLLDVTDVAIGTAWARSLEYTGTGTIDTAEHRLFLFGISMEDGKDFTRDVSSIDSTSFSASIVPTLTPMSGSVSASGTDVSGVGTQFNRELAVGDRVLIGTTLAEVATITSPTSFTTTASVGTIAAGTSINALSSIITTLNPYILPLHSSAVKTIRDLNGVIDTEYVISKSFSFTTIGTTHVITLTGGETFMPIGHTVVEDTGTLSTSARIEPTYTLNGNSTQITISGLTGTTNYKALLVVKRSGTFAKEKIKSFASKTITLNNAGTQTFENKHILLGEADCIRLVKVTKSGDDVDKVNYVSTGEVDVTRFFTFSSGQRSEYYDIGSITTSVAFKNPLKITFEYFNHSDGDYFSADSYANIPEKYKGWYNNLRLQDCFDFRSRISDAGDEFNNATGGAVSEPLHKDYAISTSYSVYKSRQDSLWLNSQGKLSYSTNSTSKTDNSMKLCNIFVAPYTFNVSKEVKFVPTQIQTYTMKNIDDIMERIKTAEYYIALNEHEKNVLNISLKDEFGLEKPKYGYVVESFKDYSIADINSTDLKCTIANESQYVRAIVTKNVLSFKEIEGSTDSSRQSNGYKITGTQVTLPYTEESAIAQVRASRGVSLQEFSSIDFTGQLEIYPDTDIYVDNLYNTVTTRTIGTPVVNTTTNIVYVEDPAPLIPPSLPPSEPPFISPTDTTTITTDPTTTVTTIPVVTVWSPTGGMQPVTEPPSPPEVANDFVTGLYASILGRMPEPAGYAWWNEQLDTGRMTALEVISGITNSPEANEIRTSGKTLPVVGGSNAWWNNLSMQGTL